MMLNTLPVDSPGDEIQPYVVYRIDGGQLECALWKLSAGEVALALFLTSEAAAAYQVSAQLDAEWKSFCPAKDALLQILKSCAEAGIGHAVLNPDLEKAKRLFHLPTLLSAAGV